MGSGLITVFLPIALAIIMAGLGLELTINDFKRVRQHPKAVFIALFCQLVILVGIAFIICKVLAFTTNACCWIDAPFCVTGRTNS